MGWHESPFAADVDGVIRRDVGTDREQPAQPGSERGRQHDNYHCRSQGEAHAAGIDPMTLELDPVVYTQAPAPAER